MIKFGGPTKNSNVLIILVVERVILKNLDIVRNNSFQRKYDAKNKGTN